MSKFLKFLLKLDTMHYLVEYDSFDMLCFRVSKFQESVPRISCIFGFISYWKHQENTNKRTLAKSKDKLCYSTVFDNNASVF